MAMDYGDTAAPNPQGQMGTYAIDSAQSVHTQLGTPLRHGTSPSSQLWEMVGVTPMIGVNDASDEVFEPADASQLVAFAEQVGPGRAGDVVARPRPGRPQGGPVLRRGQLELDRPDALRVLGHLQRLHGAFVRRPDGNEGGVRVRDSG